MADSKTTISVKRGDTFRLELTITDTNNAEALENDRLLGITKTNYENAILSGIQEDIDAEFLNLNAAQAAYDLSTVVDISDWTITSEMKLSSLLVAQFTIEFVSPTLGVFSIYSDNTTTAGWEPRTYEVDIQFSRPGLGVTSSQTFYVSVLKDITDA